LVVSATGFIGLISPHLIKKDFNMKTRIALFLACFAIALVGCSNTVGDLLPGHIKQAYVTTNTPGQIQASYEKFNGSDWNALPLLKGQTVSVAIEVIIHTGKIHVTIIDPYGKFLWDKEYSKDTQDAFSFSATRDGDFDLIVEGKNTSGSYRIIWGAQ
jgi:hypothetical protein